MAEQVKVLTAKPGDLSSNPEPAWWKKRLIPILPRHEHTHTHTDGYNKHRDNFKGKEGKRGGRKEKKKGRYED